MSTLTDVALGVTALGTVMGIYNATQYDKMQYGKVLPGDLLRGAVDGATFIPITLINFIPGLKLPSSTFSSDGFGLTKHIKAFDVAATPASNATPLPDGTPPSTLTGLGFAPSDTPGHLNWEAVLAAAAAGYVLLAISREPQRRRGAEA